MRKIKNPFPFANRWILNRFLNTLSIQLGKNLVKTGKGLKTETTHQSYVSSGLNSYMLVCTMYDGYSIELIGWLHIFGSKNCADRLDCFSYFVIHFSFAYHFFHSPLGFVTYVRVIVELKSKTTLVIFQRKKNQHKSIRLKSSKQTSLS